MNVLSLFDGISCGQLGLYRAGKRIGEYFASEINPDSIMVTQHHFPHTIQMGNILGLTERHLAKLPKIDFIMAGSPCQDLSIANKGNKYLDGEKSKLFFEFIRIRDWIQKHNNPDVLFFFENVKTIPDVMAIMTEHIGVDPLKLNSVLVSAQRRERFYWTNIDGVTIPEDKGLKIRDIVYDNNFEVFQDERIEATKKFTKNYVKWDLSGKGHYSQQDRAFYLDGTMGTIPKAYPIYKMNIYLGDDKYRRCHPIEAERLQTLPDNYTAMIEGRTKRIGLIGDGFTVDLVAHIFKHIQIETPGFTFNYDDMEFPFHEQNHHDNAFFKEQ
jgi:site-specific DNA-cytosine methylase